MTRFIICERRTSPKPLRRSPRRAWPRGDQEASDSYCGNTDSLGVLNYHNQETGEYTYVKPPCQIPGDGIPDWVLKKHTPPTNPPSSLYDLCSADGMALFGGGLATLKKTWIPYGSQGSPRSKSRVINAFRYLWSDLKISPLMSSPSSERKDDQVGTPPPSSCGTCKFDHTVFPREECGDTATTQEMCEAKGCCYDDTDLDAEGRVFACYRKMAPSMAETNRPLGISLSRHMRCEGDETPGCQGCE